MNNAGYGQYGMVEELSEQDIARPDRHEPVRRDLGDAGGVAIPREQRSGHILQVASVGGLMAGPTLGIYHASKWALEGISESLAQEVRDFGVKVTIVEPTGYATAAAGIGAPLDAESRLRAERERFAGNRAARTTRDGEPEATRAAILAVVDAEEPPLRIIFGDGPLQMLTAIYAVAPGDVAKVGSGLGRGARNPAGVATHGRRGSRHTPRRSSISVNRSRLRRVADE